MRVCIELVLCPDINQCRALRRADKTDQLLTEIAFGAGIMRPLSLAGAERDASACASGEIAVPMAKLDGL